MKLALFGKRPAIVCLMLAIAILWHTQARAQGAEESPVLGSEATAKFMQRKLAHSQELLKAIVLEDFKGIEQEAQAISLLTQAEVWQVLQSPDYMQHSKEFRRSADQIMEAGRKKNLEAATLGYMDMTMKCVQCHKYVRGMTLSDTPELRKTIRK